MHIPYPPAAPVSYHARRFVLEPVHQMPVHSGSGFRSAAHIRQNGLVERVVGDEVRAAIPLALDVIQAALVSGISLVVGIGKGISTIGAFDESDEYLLRSLIVRALSDGELFLRCVPCFQVDKRCSNQY